MVEEGGKQTPFEKIPPSFRLTSWGWLLVILGYVLIRLVLALVAKG